MWAMLISENRTDRYDDNTLVHVGTRVFADYPTLKTYADTRCGFTPLKQDAPQHFTRDHWVFEVKPVPEGQIYINWTRHEVTARQAVPGTTVLIGDDRAFTQVVVGEWVPMGDGTAGLRDVRGTWRGTYAPDDLFTVPSHMVGKLSYVPATLPEPPTPEELEVRSQVRAENAWLRAAENSYFSPEEGGY